MKDDEKNQETELKDEKKQEPKLKKKKNPLQTVLRFSVPLVIIGVPLAFVGVYIENPQTVVDNIIFYTGVTSICAGTLGGITSHVMNYFTKAEEASYEKENPDEQNNEPFPEFEEKNNDERSLF